MDLASLDSIVLKRVKFGDTSIIATLFTRQQGKLSVIAKGARAFKSQRGLASALEPLNHIEAVVYSKPSRSVQIISSAEILDDFNTIKCDLDKIETAAKVCHHLDNSLFEVEALESVWCALLSFLEGLSLCGGDQIDILGLIFRARLLSAGGFEPIVGGCAVCGSGNLNEGSVFTALQGGILCPSCATGGIALDFDDIAILKSLFYADPRAEILTIPKAKVKKIEALLNHHEEYHSR